VTLPLLAVTDAEWVTCTQLQQRKLTSV